MYFCVGKDMGMKETGSEPTMARGKWLSVLYAPPLELVDSQDDGS